MTSTIATYYQARASHLTMGFDGMGAIDFEKSDISNSADLKGVGSNGKIILTKGTDQEPPTIVMRRGVRPFDFFVMGMYRSVLIDPSYWDSGLFSDLIFEGLVECKFGRKTKKVVFAYPKVADVWGEGFDFPSATFKRVLGLKFGFGAFDGEVATPKKLGRLVIEDNVKIDSFEDAQKMLKGDYKSNLNPSHLELPVSKHPSVFCFRRTLVLVRQDLVLASLASGKSGMRFTYPNFPVTVKVVGAPGTT
ncbi:MAG: hypothetical protein AAF689_17840 [Pseudomonadota bacterium]